MHNFKELKIWQKSRAFVKDIYILTKQLPTDELFVLTSQMRRAAISIPSNIAEGAGRESDKDFSRFLDIANGSAFELESQIYIACDLEYYSEEKMDVYLEKVQELQKMIYHFKKHLNSQS
jgi:four helix bundle protein